MRVPALVRPLLTTAVCAAIALTGSAPAFAAQRPAATATAVRSVTVTAADLTDLIRRARAAGADVRALEEARRQRLTTLGVLPSGLQKMIIVFALRHGGDLLSKLVATVDPAAAEQLLLHATLLADFLEQSDTIVKDLLVSLLTQVGVPAAIAGIIAGVLVTALQG
jgi:hypothetical protein